MTPRITLLFGGAPWRADRVPAPSVSVFRRSLKRPVLGGWLAAGLFLMLGTAVPVLAQPTIIATSIADGSFPTNPYALTDRGTFRQSDPILATTGGTGRAWLFAQGSVGSPDYNNKWNPYSGDPTQIAGFNTYINPTTQPASARWSGSGGQNGTFPNVTSGRYYTFNITENAAGVGATNTMQVLETSFIPVTISSVVPSGIGFIPGLPITITVTTSAAPATDEFVYIRYSNNGFASNNNLVQVNFPAGSNVGTANIPGQPASTTVTYYAMSSNKTIAQITADNTANSTALGFDMATLRLNNNGGSNYTYGVNASGSVSGNVVVAATAGTTGPTSYTNLNAAFAAINAGTHQGAINIYLNTTTISEVTNFPYLQQSGVGTSNYTSVLIQPIIDGVTIQGTAGQPNGLVNIFGSNVTINGDNPNTGLVNVPQRNLTFLHTGGTALTFTAVVRVGGFASPATPVTVSNVSIRNCIITGHGTSGVISSSPSNNTFGIYAANDNTQLGSVSANSITLTPTGAKIANLTIANNLIQTTARAIFVSGTGTVPVTGLSITGNTVGSGTAGNISALGINVVNATSASITNNTVQGLTAFVNDNRAGTGISVGTANSGSSASPTITGNTVNAIQNSGGPATGIWVASGTSSPTISSNIISSILQTGGSTASAAIGINVVSTTTAATVSGNVIATIGNNSTAATGQAVGIWLNNAASATVSGNTIGSQTSVTTVYNTNTGITANGSPSTAAAAAGILVDGSTTTPTVSGNIVTNVKSINTSGYTAVGIDLAGVSGNSLTVNNAVSDVNAWHFSSNSNYLTTYGIFGIRLNTGTATTHRFYYNSVYLSGAALGNPNASEHTSCLLAATTTATVDIRNNALANTRSGTGSMNTCLSLSSALTSGSIINNNAYYSPGTTASTSAGNFIAQTITASATFATYLAGNFNAGATSPTSNLRFFTNGLTAGNDNRSFAVLTTGPSSLPFTSTTNLTIPTGPPATQTQIESGAAVIAGVTTDLTGATRATGTTFPPTATGQNPDIGAYEGAYTPLLPLTVSGSTYTQTNTQTSQGAADQLVTSITVNTTGTVAGITLNSVTFNLGGSAVPADITDAKLWYNTTNTFTGATLLGTQSTIGGTMTITATTPQALAAGSNFFFLSYSIANAPTSTQGNTVAAVPTSIAFSTGSPSVPTGTPGPGRTIADLTAPVIVYTTQPATTTTSTADQTVVATITDNSGTISSALLYYRKGTTGAYASVSASVSGSSYTFTLPASGLGLVPGDVVQYYVAAQDPSANVTTNPAGGSGATPPGSTPPGSPNQYSILFSVAGTYNVGAGQTYTSLTGSAGFFNFVNSNIVTNTVTVNIVSNTTETGAVGLNAFAAFPMTIQPDATASVFTLEGALASSGTASANGLIRLNTGVTGVTFDGGASKRLRFRNTGSAPTLLIFGAGSASANSIVITNSIVEGGFVASSDGTIVVSASPNVTISNNDIRERTDITATEGQQPRVAIYGSGASGSLTIKGNTIRNFAATGIFMPNTATGNGWTVGGATTPDGNLIYNESTRTGSIIGVQLQAGTGHTVRFNSLYQTAGTLSGFTGISISGSSTGGHLIGNNTIGGAAADATGGVFTLSSGAFNGITLNITSPTSLSTVRANTVRNITNNSTLFPTIGINAPQGLFTIGGATAADGNLIGGTAGQGIAVVYSGTSNQASSGISAVPTVTGSSVQNNSVQGLAMGTATSTARIIVGIYVQSAASTTTTVSNNLVNNLTVASTAFAGSTAYGLQFTGTGNYAVSANTVSNLTVNAPASGAPLLNGILGSTSGTSTVSNNTVSGLSFAGSPGSTSTQTVGLFLTNGAYTATGNTVSGIAATNTTAASTSALRVQVVGIGLNNVLAGTVVAKNRVYDITSAAPASGSNDDGAQGISIFGTMGGGPIIANNQISLATGTAANVVVGIIDGSSGTTNNRIFYNSVYIGGSANADSYGYRRTATPTVQLRNNIFYNERTGAGNAYGIGVTSATSWTATPSDYNYFLTPSAAAVNNWLGAAQTLAAWRTSSGGDNNSFYDQPSTVASASVFENTAVANLNILASFNSTPSVIESRGVVVSGVTDDYAGTTRATGAIYPPTASGQNPDLGSFEYAGTLASPITYSASAVSNITGSVYAGQNNQAVIRVAVTTTGQLGSINLTSLAVRATGTTNIANLTGNVRVYSTGLTNTFSTATLFGTATAAPTTTSQVLTFTGTQALQGGTNYFWIAYDITAGSPTGNVVGAEITGLSGDGFTSVVPTPASGTRSILGAMSGNYTVGRTLGNETYLTLTAAMADLTLRGVAAGPSNVTFRLTNPAATRYDNVTGGETFPIVIPALGSSTQTVSIVPHTTTTNPLIVGSVANNPLLQLNGTDYLTIDGNNGSGNRLITVRNTSGSGQAVQFLNDATFNALRFLTLESNNTSNATVVFGTSSGTLGNSDNAIANCDLRDRSDVTGVPANAISSTGTVGALNARNVIQSNVIRNFSSVGISLGATGNGGGWLIGGTTGGLAGTTGSLGNQFYQEANRTSAPLTVVLFNSATSNGNTIANNTVDQPTANTIGSSSNGYTVFNLAAGNNHVVSANAIYQSNDAAEVQGIFRAVNVSGGNGHTISNNSIGGQTATRGGSLPLYSLNFQVFNLVTSAGTAIEVQGNLVGNIRGYNAGNTNYMVNVTGAGNANIGTTTGNVFGGSTSVEPIRANYDLEFVNTSSTGTVVIANNTMANVTQTASTSAERCVGVIATGSGANVTVRNNIIRDWAIQLTSTATTVTGYWPYGIGSAATGTVTIEGNQIYNLVSQGSGNILTLAGIVVTTPGAGSVIRRNRIYGLGSTNTTGGASSTIVWGILSNGATTTSFLNNQIRLGDTGARTRVRGIEEAGTGSNAYYFNSVVINGSTISTNINTKSYAFYRSSAGTVNVRNNVLVNVRTDAGATGGNFAIGRSSTTNWTSNFNNLFAAASGQTGENTTTALSFSGWQAATGTPDANSKNVNPAFVDLATGNLNLTSVSANCPLNGTAQVISGVNGEYDNALTSRQSSPDIGSDEFYGLDFDAASLNPASPVCNGTALTGTVQGTGPFTGTYTANGGSAQTLAFTGNTFSIPTGTPTGSVVYVVTLTSDAGGCTVSPAATATTTVTVRAALTAVLTNSGPVCNGDAATATLTLGGSTGTYNLSYTINGGSAVNLTNQTSPVVVSLPAPLTTNQVVQLTALSDNTTGCTASAATLTAATTTVTVNPLPTATFDAVTTPVCAGTSQNVTGTLTGATPFAGTYTVNGGSPQTLPITGSTFSIPTGTLTANATYAIASLTGAGCTAASLPSSVTITVTNTTTWTGATSADWQDGTNWTACVPTAFVDATIPNVTPAPVLSSGTGAVRDLTIQAGGSLTVSGGATGLQVNGAFTNAGTFASAVLTTFNGNAATLVPAGSYAGVTLVGTTNKTLTGTPTISGTLTMDSGLLLLGNNNLTLTGTTSTVSGASTSAYLATNGTGVVTIQSIGSSGRTGAILFPIGTATANTGASTGYAPATLTNTGTTDNFSASVTNVVPTGTGTTANPLDHVVKKTWDVTEATPGGSNVTLKLVWNAPLAMTGDEGTMFARNICTISHFQGGAWVAGPLGAAVPEGLNNYSRTRSGLTSFSPFAVEDDARPLPVELTAFAAERKGADAQLSWTTATERNSRGFEVQVATQADGEFRTLGFVPSQNPTSTAPLQYTFLDTERAKVGTRYYRLRMLDLDGTADVSSVKTVLFEAITKAEVTAVPNPFRTSLQVWVTAPAAGTATLTLTDALGRTILTQTAPVTVGANTLTPALPTSLARGAYLLTTTVGGEVFRTRLVKE